MCDTAAGRSEVDKNSVESQEEGSQTLPTSCQFFSPTLGGQSPDSPHSADQRFGFPQKPQIATNRDSDVLLTPLICTLLRVIVHWFAQLSAFPFQRLTIGVLRRTPDCLVLCLEPTTYVER